MLKNVADYLDRVERSLNPQDKMINLWLSQTSLDWLLVQYGYFKIAFHDCKSSNWKALQGLIDVCSKILDIRVPVLGAFYNTYGATGSFVLNKMVGRPVGSDYFLVLVDELDSPLYWLLVLHELAHCWLSSRSTVEEIRSQINTDLEPEFEERRVEESLCDAIATALVGPSYVYSFINRLWLSFAISPSQVYPKNSFRLELMMRILKQTGHVEVGDLEALIEDSLINDWKDEAIVDALEPIVDFVENMPFAITPTQLVTDLHSVSDFETDPPMSFQKLFHVGWNLINEAEMGTYHDWSVRISAVICNVLERNCAPLNT